MGVWFWEKGSRPFGSLVVASAAALFVGRSLSPLHRVSITEDELLLRWPMKERTILLAARNARRVQRDAAPAPF